MTRDQAMNILMAETRNSCTEDAMKEFIDMSLALGMLTLDEPKTLQHRICDALSGIKVGRSGWVDDINIALADAGLRITEK